MNNELNGKLNLWKQQIPEGVQDFLPDECYNKRLVEETLRKVFCLSGYNEIDTPIFEYLDMFRGNSAIEQEQMYKFLEPGSRIMVLRPDVTMPIARIAATKLKTSPLPIRLSYISSVYRYEDLRSAKQREISQAGVELLGSNSPEADAEVITIAIESLQALGLSEFQIDIGQVEFFKGLVEEAGLTEAEAENLRHLIDQKNVLALEMFLKKLSIPNNIKDHLLQLPMFFDNGDLLNMTLKLTKNERCTRALENIAQVYRILKNYGVSKYIAIDLGMVQSLDYYTGIIFRGITKELGYPICGGGRYDNLAAEFGADVPATGFAIGIKRILVAQERQNRLAQIPGIDILFVHDPIQDEKGYDLVKKLRSEGFRVEIYIPSSNSQDFKSYARKKGIHRVLHMKRGMLDDIEIG
jgi:ATP phosphoribosyltransferase regulatory subunit